MTNCELCGQETDSTTKIKLEGAQLQVCSSCSDMGESVSTSKKRKSSNRKTSSTPRESRVLVKDYGQKVKNARESEDMTQAELADLMNEKESRISKIEGERLKPDEKLGKKLKKHLGVELYTNPEVSNVKQKGGTDSRSATLGDVADIS
jgi:putative transcription factor